MLEILKFCVSGFWRFCGCFLLLALVCELLSNIVANICKTIAACHGINLEIEDNDENKDDKEEE